MPPITPEQLAEASTRLDKLTQKLEKTILDDICRRIARAGTITDTAEWQMMRLMRQGGGAQAPQPGAPAGNRGGQSPRRR